MADSLFSPISEQGEVESLLNELPIAVDRDRFLHFVLGFPRSYLVNTPRVDIVKHFLLVDGLGDQPLMSSLSQQEDQWKLWVVTHDRTFLVARISGALSCYGMNIVAAQAFANAHFVALDRFRFRDPAGRFQQEEQRRLFLHFLERVMEDDAELEARIQENWASAAAAESPDFQIAIDNQAHPTTTRISLDCHDHFGLLYLVSRCISESGYTIEIAQAQTPGDRVHDEFYLTRAGKKLSPAEQEELKAALLALRERYASARVGGPVEGA